LSRAKV